MSRIGAPTTLVVANKIAELHVALREEYGSDYSIFVTGGGRVVASTRVEDVIANPSPELARCPCGGRLGEHFSHCSVSPNAFEAR
jgi:hypothetical protein